MRLSRRWMLLCALTVVGCGGPHDSHSGDELTAVDELTGQTLLDLAATYDMNRLLEDGDLTGGSGITPDQVQQFLQQKGSYLAGYRDPVWSNKTAATLIVERSRAHGISPLYILSRIQIESGLIQSGTSTNLIKATGCGCPDSGGCSSSYEGFGNQVECGAAKIRNYLTDLDAGRPTVSGWKVGLTKQTLDPCTVTPANKATAALYTYTPWVGAYATQCGRTTVGGSSLVSAVFFRYRTDYNWSMACTVGGAILTRYNQLGGAGGVLGGCMTSELTTPDGIGRYNHFQNGSIYWMASTGAHEVRGLIRDRWSALGWEKSSLGYPTTNEMSTPDNVGRFNHFQNGSIYFTQDTGAHEVRGLIHARWEALNWEKGDLGYPTTDELAASDGVGRYNNFRKGTSQGAIYWTPALGAWSVHGDIYLKWAALGLEKSALGYPVTDETVTPDGVGRFNHFRKGSATDGSIYWTATTGAHEVHGPIRAKWAELGWEKSSLGYPMSDEYAVTGGRESEFQRGFLTLNTATNTVSVRLK